MNVHWPGVEGLSHRLVYMCGASSNELARSARSKENGAALMRIRGSDVGKD